MTKFKICNATELCDEWDSLVQNSLEGNIFFLSHYLKATGLPFTLYFVKKGEAFKAGFVVITDAKEKETLLDDLVIYNGIFFLNDPTHKETKARAQRFAITEEVINFLDTCYEKVRMQLSPEFEDIRPFLWHNYHSQNAKEKFVVDVRYTSYIDISSIVSTAESFQSTLFMNLETLRQRNIKEAKRKNAYTKIEVQVSLFLEYYKVLLHSQNIALTTKKIEKMNSLITALIQKNLASMYISYSAEAQIQYITIFCWDNKRAYYLFGAPNPEATERYKGSICFWDAFVDLAQRGIKEVDMEGVNSPQRGWFKLSLGGKLKPYYKIRKE